MTPVRLVGEVRFAPAQFHDRLGKIAVPFDRVHREIEVCVEDHREGADRRLALLKL